MTRCVEFQSVTSVTFGLAGVIHTAGRSAGPEDVAWLSSAFRSVPQSSRTDWCGENVAAVCVQHANETHQSPGTRSRRVASAGPLRGVINGTFFGVGSLFDADDFNARMLQAYRQDGPLSFRSINGMWAAAVWDAEARRAHFVRDPTGQQALYVAPLQDRILFATDLRVFQAAGLLDTFNEQAIAEFLHYLYVPAPLTLLSGCHAVLPGHVLTVGPGVEQKRYASPRFVRGESLDPSVDPDRAIEDQLPEFEERLLAAVADCIPRTGRVAVTLSGGKDSSTVAVALSKICPERVLALTVGQKSAEIDEAEHAALVCKSLGLAHQSYLPTDQELASGIYAFARQHDQPIGDPAALPYFLGMSSLPEDCTVILDGSANDYYFGLPHPVKGALHYQRRVDLQRYVPDALWPLVLRLMAAGPRELGRLSQQWSKPIEETWVAWEGWPSGELQDLLGRPISFEHTYLWQKMREGANTDWLSLITDVVFGVWQPHTDFRKANDLAHSAGRGIRMPFADDRIASYVNALPEQVKIRGGKNKMLLRAYMAKNLPREIVDKPKRGFIFDLNRLLQNPVHQWVDELNRAGLLKVLPSWSDRSIQDLVRRHRDDPENPGWQQRLYVLCLLATVVALKQGYVPALAG